MNRAPLALLLGGILLQPGTSDAGAGLRAVDVRLRWDRPSCFGYSAADRGYACVDFAVGADAGDPGLGDFEQYAAPAATAWHGHKAIALVAAETTRLAIASKEYDRSRRIARERTPRAAVKLALARGYRRPVRRSRPLPIGRWTRFHGTRLRFDTRMHEGDASYQNHGQLRLRCPSGTIVTVVADNQAESAVAFAARRAPTLAIGFVEVDGGEGAEYYNSRYIRLDPAALCRD
jgi:hypothetical protein